MVAVGTRPQGEPLVLEEVVASAGPLLARPARRDALPEHTHYMDTGCEIHPSCLTCPLVRCRYDEPGGARKLLSEERDRSIIEQQREGRGINAIARRFGVSRRTVFRVLARSRTEEGDACGPTKN